MFKQQVEMGMLVSARLCVAMLLSLAGSAATGQDGSTVVVSAADVKFVPANPTRPDGPKLAVLRGDPSTGPSDMLFLQTKGATPFHRHSSSYHLTLIRGSMKHWGAAGSEDKAMELGPGSYWFQPGGEDHVDLCLSEECLMFIHWAGKRDTVIANQ